MKDLLGIDIGTGTIRFVSKDQYYTIETPENAVKDGEVIAFDGLSSVIHEVVKTNHLKEKKVAFTLPDASVYIDRFTMPYMSIKQLNFNLPYEFKDVVENDKNDYQYDYAMISHDDKEMEILGAAVDKALLEKYVEMFKKAGLKLVKCTCRQMAISDLLRLSNIQQDVVLVNLGYTFTTVDIYKAGFYDKTRTIEIGVKDLVKVVSELLYCDEHIAKQYLFDNKDDVIHKQKMIDIYEEVATHISRAVNYYGYENPDNTLQSLYYYGSGSSITPFIEAIESGVTINVDPVNELFHSKNEIYLNALNALGASRGSL